MRTEILLYFYPFFTNNNNKLILKLTKKKSKYTTRILQNLSNKSKAFDCLLFLFFGEKTVFLPEISSI